MFITCPVSFSSFNILFSFAETTFDLTILAVISQVERPIAGTYRNPEMGISKGKSNTKTIKGTARNKSVILSSK